MWWSERAHVRQAVRAALLLGLIGLGAACAFEPVYGPGNAGSRLDRAVIVAEPSTTATFTMARALEQRFGPVATPSYRLDYRLRVRSEDAAITSGQEIDRVNLIGTLSYTLRSEPGGETVTTGTADGFVSYSSAGNVVAINAARSNAEDRLAQILADRLYVFLVSDPALAAPGAGTAP